MMMPTFCRQPSWYKEPSQQEIKKQSSQPDVMGEIQVTNYGKRVLEALQERGCGHQ